MGSIKHCLPLVQDEERMRELEDRDAVLRDTQKLLDMAREEKRECEEKLAAVKRDGETQQLQLQQKETEIQRSRNLVRLLLIGDD